MVTREAERLRPLLADDVVYHNTGRPAAVGIDAVAENLAGQFAQSPTPTSTGWSTWRLMGTSS
jgi:hypothetical protein